MVGTPLRLLQVAIFCSFQLPAGRHDHKQLDVIIHDCAMHLNTRITLAWALL